MTPGVGFPFEWHVAGCQCIHRLGGDGGRRNGDVVYIVMEDQFGGLQWGVFISGALFFTPGMWTILKRYLRIFSFRFLGLVLLMLSRDLSPNIFRSGWCDGQVLTSASASPSIGAYLDSAACVNLLPTRVIFPPCLQQKRLLEGQEQCFWNDQ